ncbi:hypothetical protein L9F63_016005, partial [Diploptera punctata]
DVFDNCLDIVRYTGLELRIPCEQKSTQVLYCNKRLAYPLFRGLWCMFLPPLDNVPFGPRPRAFGFSKTATLPELDYTLTVPMTRLIVTFSFVFGATGGN